MIEKNEMKLLLIGFSNWDYYMDRETDGVFAFAKKDSGASDSFFGSVDYFKKWLLNELSKNDKYERRLTATGFGVIPEYIIK